MDSDGDAFKNVRVCVELHSWQDFSTYIILAIKMSFFKASPVGSMLRQRELVKSPLSSHTDEAKAYVYLNV